MNYRKGKPDKRGNSYDKRARKLWILATFGDGKKCKCTHCGMTVTYETVESDRKVPGGSYEHKNIQPSCRPCNIARGDDVTWVHPSRRAA